MQTIIIQGHEYINIKIARSLTGYDETYLQKLALQGKIKAQKIGRAWAIEKQSILEYAKRPTRTQQKKTSGYMRIKAMQLGHKMRVAPDRRVFCTHCGESITYIYKENLPCKKQ